MCSSSRDPLAEGGKVQWGDGRVGYTKDVCSSEWISTHARLWARAVGVGEVGREGLLTSDHPEAWTPRCTHLNQNVAGNHSLATNIKTAATLPTTLPTPPTISQYNTIEYRLNSYCTR
jgi:hypothetical protein